MATGQSGFSISRRTGLRLRQSARALALAITVLSCSTPAPPLAIRMHNPQTNQTLHCTARSDNAANAPILAGAVEACAKQLEANGFVRDN